MKFDAIEQKKEQEKKITKKDKKSLLRLTKIYPISGVRKDNIVKLKIHGKELYALVMDTKKYDLELLDEDQANFATENYWSFHRQFSGSFKEIFMNFPEDNQRQQAYIRYKRDRASDVNQMRILQTELEKMKYIEKEYKKSASYVVIYGETEKELMENLGTVQRFSMLFEPKILKKDKVKQLFSLLNNTGGVILVDDEKNGH